jgi:3-hydroxymyristoyl/3-hydroxydecanoyl-(acyl carrier protein) dehydratase
MTGGSMSKILGDNYIQTDKHSVRSRMPLPPYMFVTRITKLNAEYGKAVPSSLEMEYDIDDDCVYLQGDNTISNVVYTEASQVGIFLGSYIGVDIVKDKALRFRVVDSKITFASERELKKGETLRLVYSIDKFTRRGDTVFANCTYSCYCGDEKILETIAIGGYFTEEDLCNNKGIINPRLKVNVLTADKGYEVPVKRAAKHYDKEHIEYYLMGDMRKCFNDDSFGAYQPQRGVKREVWMLDEVTDINTSGGKFGLGYIEGFKDVDESHWVFKAHFKNDPVMPGTLVLNGANQLFTFWSVYYGFYDANIENKPTVMTGATVDVAFRGQVKCTESRIKYRIDIKKVYGEGVPYAVLAQVNVFLNDVNIIREDNVSMAFKKQ